MMGQLNITPLASENGGASAILEFWKAAGPTQWFAKDPSFDQRFRERFATLYEQAARGELDTWRNCPRAALALVLLLDQYPRNAFRGTRRVYATDQLAVHHANYAVLRGYDRRVDEALQFFFYLPFGHSESLADQERGLLLGQHLGAAKLQPAIEHAEVVRRFGRFPHRNSILGRPSTQAELDFLRQGGFAG